jgi:hypothetical protein
MFLEAKDLISLVVIVGLFALIGLGKITVEQGLPIVASIAFYYLGIHTGVYMERSAKKKES